MSGIAGSIRNVNPTGGTMNCVNCAIATDATLAGRPASALPGDTTLIGELERHFGRQSVKIADKQTIIFYGGALSAYQIRLLLSFETRYELDSFLRIMTYGYMLTA